MTPRETALKLLVMTDRSGRYSNIALDSALKKQPDLSALDRRFVSALYYGVIERTLTLDFIIDMLCSRPSDKLSLELREILRMGLYQILYMDSVPESAAVNESVKLASKLKNSGAAGFVNATLRNFLRSGAKIPKTGVKLKDLSIEYSCPEWLVKHFIDDYGEKTAVEILKRSLGPAPMTVRLNTLKLPAGEIVSKLEAEGVKCAKTEGFPESAELFSHTAVEGLESYKNGLFHVQDLSCQLCCKELDPKPGEVVLDLCAAPGGKTFTLAEMSGDKAKIFAYDLHANRVKLIASGAKRLGLTSVSAAVNDAKVFNGDIPLADKVLCDVPCSGLGVIRRKPEIKYRAEESCEALIKTQYAVLETSSKYLKPGGTLIYSTCTLRKAENEDVVSKFLSEHDGYEPVKLDGFTDWKMTITPELFSGDGFFIAKIRRKR